MNTPWYKNQEFLISAFISIATLFGIVVAKFSDLIVIWGHRIPQKDIGTDYMTALGWAITLGISIFFWSVPQRDKKILLWLWVGKTLVTLVFMLLYEDNYGLDSYSYFSESLKYDFPMETVGSNGTTNTIFIAWLHNQIFPASYHALKVSFSMVGMISIYIFYRAAEIFFQQSNPRLLYILGFFPSILFWSSILGKDPLIILGIALYFYGVVGLFRLQQLRYIIPLALGIAIAIFIRTWLGPILAFPLIVFAWGSVRGILPKLLFLTFAIAALLFTFNQFTNQFRLESAEDALTTTNTISKTWEQGGSNQALPQFTGVNQMIAFAPVGIFTALFRPLPGEVLNPFGLLAGFENLFLLFLFGQAVKRSRWQTLREPIVMWAIVLVLVWSTIYGFISSQNLGSGVRYRLQILPIFLILLLYIRAKGTKVIKRNSKKNLENYQRLAPRKSP